MKIHPFLFSILFITACNAPGENGDAVFTSVLRGKYQDRHSETNDPPYESFRLLPADSVWYVVNEYAADVYTTPDYYSKSITSLEFGKPVQVSRIFDTTIDNTTRTWAECSRLIIKPTFLRGQKIEKKVHQKLYILFSDLGPENDLYITNAQLYEAYDEEYSTTNSLSTRKLKIQIISQEEFYDVTNPNDWSHHINSPYYDAIRKKLVLPLDSSDTPLTFTSDPIEEEGGTEHAYAGILKELSCYIILNSYYESHSFSMYNKANGTLMADLMGYPFVSPGKTKLISVYDNPYGEGSGNLEIYTIDRNKPYTKLIRYYFQHWSPCDDPTEIRWISENEFTIKVHTIGLIFRNKDSDYYYTSPKTGYLKIKIL